MIRKFFDSDAAEVATGGGFNVAQLLAQHGKMNNTEVGASADISPIITEKKEEPKTDEASQAATAENASTGQANQDSPSPTKVEDKPVVEQKAPAEQPSKSWQEALRNQQPDTVLKELGYDEKVVNFLGGTKDLDPKVIGFLQAYKEGKHVEYLQEWTTDYSKMSADEVMRHQLHKEYPKANPQQLEVLFKREVIKAYDLDSDDEDLKLEGQSLLEAKAEKFREVLINEQQNKLLPKAPQPVDNSAAEAQVKAEAAQRHEQYQQSFRNNDYYKNIVGNKNWSFGEGDEKFNFPVDQKSIDEVLFTDKWQENMFDEEGKPNIEHQILVGLVNKYGISLFEEFAKHFRSLGAEKIVTPIENASNPGSSSPSPSEKAPASPAEAMARQGTLRI